MFSCKPRLLHSGLEPAGSRRMRQSHIWLVDECDRKRAAAEQCFDQRSKQSLCRPAQVSTVEWCETDWKERRKSRFEMTHYKVKARQCTHYRPKRSQQWQHAWLSFAQSMVCAETRDTRDAQHLRRRMSVDVNTLWKERDNPQVHQFKQYLHQWRSGHRRY